MLTCPRCTTANAPGAVVCAVCGLPLRGSAPNPTKATAPLPTATLLGHASPFGQAPARPAAPAAPAPQHSPPGQRPMNDLRSAKTMLGLSPVQPPPSAQTMRLSPGHPLPAPAPAVPPSESAPAARLPSQFKTVLGVARPGIAPLNPGVPKPPLAAPGPAPRPALHHPAPFQPRPAEEFEPFQPAGVPLKRAFSPKLAVIGGIILATALALMAIVAIALIWRRASPVTASLRSSNVGPEQLELECKECKDGALAALGSASARFEGGHARLDLATPLHVGNNELTLAIREPDSSSAREVSIVVPVQYRVHADLAGLADARPQLRVIVEALPESAVVVDGRALRIDAAGKGSYPIDVTGDLTGAKGTIATLERVVPYTITSPGAAAQSGEVHVKIAITPLVVSAPGESIIIEGANFMLAGQTQPNGTVTVAGRPITVDPAGRFAQLMSVSAVGETTIEVRAAAQNAAPRLFPLRVQRVTSLKAVATSFAATATQGLSGIAGDPQLKKGWAVVLAGTLLETRIEQHTTIAVMEVRKGCNQEPCLVRLVYGAEAPFGKGAQVRAYGHVQGAVDGPRSGTKIPDVRVEFYLPGND